MKKLLLIVSALTFVSAETSVFEKNSIESKKKYGFSETEQYIYDNKKEIDNLKGTLFNLTGTLDDQVNSQSGVRTVVITNSKKISKNEKDTLAIEQKIKNLEEYVKKLEETLNLTVKKVESLEAENKKLTQQFVKMEKELSTKASKESVKKASKNLLKEINRNKRTVRDIKRLVELKKPEISFKGKDPEKLLGEVKRLMGKRDYDAARARLSYLANNTEFSKARVLYFLGEVEYQTSNFKKATKAFKASGSLNSKANYMPTLLYHAAISYQRIGDKANAKSFYQTLIDNYPKSNLIAGAKKRMEKIK